MFFKLKLFCDIQILNYSDYMSREILFLGNTLLGLIIQIHQLGHLNNYYIM